MIQSLHNNRRSGVALILIAVIIVPFALFEVSSIFQYGRVQNVASVNGEDISSIELAREVRYRQNELASLLGEYADPSQYSEEALRPLALETLIRDKLIKAMLKDSGLGMSDNSLKEQIAQMSEFQVNGVFSPAIYTNVLQSQGYTSKTFLKAIEEDSIKQQFSRAIQGSAFTTSQSLDSFIGIIGELRSFTYLRLPIAKKTQQVTVSEAEIESHYNSNKQDYLEPEKVIVDYIALNREAFASKLIVSEKDIKERYQLKKDQSQGIQSEVAHILIEEKADSSHRNLIAEVQKNLTSGKEFASLVKEFSQDAGTANKGGNLGFTNGSTFPQAFEKAVSQLEVGQVSEPVKTDSGYHFIRLISKAEGTLGSLEKETQVIRQELLDETSQQIYLDTVETLKEKAYASDNLTELVASMKSDIQLTVQRSQSFSRSGGEGIAQYPTLVNAAFSSEVFQDKLNSKVIELPVENAPNNKQAIVLSVQSIVPAHIPKLQTLQDTVKEALKKQKAEAALQKIAYELVEKIDRGEDLETLSQQYSVDWRAQIDASRQSNDEVDKLAFSIESNELPTTKIHTLAEGDLIVLHLQSKKKGSSNHYSETQKLSFIQQMNQSQAFQELNAYQNYMYSMADIDTDIAIRKTIN